MTNNFYVGFRQGLAKVPLDDPTKAELTLAAGPVFCITVDPLEPKRVYAATLGEGLWSSSDAGASWERIGDGLDNPVVWSVAVSRSDRVNGLGVVYAGTQMSELYRSDDGGETFRRLTSFDDLPSRSEWSFPPKPDTHHVHQIAPDPNVPGVVLVGIEQGGVVRSEDGGETWVDLPGDDDYDVHTLLSHPQAPNRFYESGGASYCESFDAGKSWRRELGGFADEVRYFYAMAVDPADPDTIVISAARDPFGGHNAPVPGFTLWSTLYRREAGGAWQEVTEGLPDRDSTAMGMLTTSEDLGGVFFYATVLGEVYRSDDAGASWNAMEIRWPDALAKREMHAVATGRG